MRLGFAGLVAAQSMIFGLAVSISPPVGSERLIIHIILALAALGVFILAGAPIWQSAIKAARKGKIVMEQLFLLGIAGAFGASLHSTITGYGHVYYEVVAILVAIYTFGKLIGERRRRAALEAARALGEDFDQCEVVTCCGEVHRARARDVVAGDRVLVRAGMPIPIDGVIVEGMAFVRETALTGEPFPVVRRVGDDVMAGSYSVDGLLTIRAAVSGQERRLDVLLRSVRDAQEKPSDLQLEADRLVAWFLPLVLAISVLTFLFWTWRETWIVGMFNALAVLLVACPCSMGLATPVGIWSALAALAERGIVPRDRNLVERLAGVTHVVFDKTGTLGEDELERVDMVTSATTDRSGLLAAVARLQAASAHPVARAFHREGAEPAPSRFLAGAGIEGEVDGIIYHIGNEGVVPTEERQAAAQLAAELKSRGTHVVYVLAGGRIVAVAALREKLRARAHEVLAELEAMGLSCQVMTGDRAEAAAQHGFSDVQAGLTPEGKAALMRGLRERGVRTLFVGDGVNDAPAMSEASASLATGSACALAKETATGEMTSSDLASVPFAISRCRAAIYAIRSNLRFAAAYNAVGIALAAGGILHPVAAALLMLVSSFTVTSRALRQSKVSSRKKATLAIPWRMILLTGALAIQGPVIVYLGGFNGVTALAFVVLFFAAAACCALWIARRPLGAFSEMALGMFSVGGLAMLIGWWADAGFAPVVREGVCLCGCVASNMGLGLFAKWNWMDASMVVASVPAVFFEETRNNRWMYWGVGVLGMLIGMEAAAWMMGHLPMAYPQASFFGTYGAMVFGMCFGMILACGTWQNWKTKH